VEGVLVAVVLDRVVRGVMVMVVKAEVEGKSVCVPDPASARLLLLTAPVGVKGG